MIRLKKWADRLSPDNPTLTTMLGGNIVIGSWNVEQGLPRWIELAVSTSDCRLAGPDAAFMAEVIARLGGAAFAAGFKPKHKDRRWLDLARVSALMLGRVECRM